MKRAGFTLVEIIVVIAILALLISILLPSLQNAREKARSVVCLSNQKQLAILMLFYENDYSTFPHCFKADPINPPSDNFGFYQHNHLGWLWQNYLESYFSDLKRDYSILACPSRKVYKSKLKKNLLCSNYGANMSVCKEYSKFHILKNKYNETRGLPLSLESVPSPSQTVLLLDSGYNMINYHHTMSDVSASGNDIEDYCYVPGASSNESRSIWPGQEPDAISGRHLNKTVNSVFVDGHAEHRKADSFIVEETETGYVNVSPLWVPR